MVDYKPTRSELIRLKQRVKLATKGKDILKRKLDALVVELRKMLSEVKEARKEFNELYEEARKTMALALAYDGIVAIKSAAINSGITLDLEIQQNNIMGINVPKISYQIHSEGNYLMGSSLRIIDAAKKYRELLLKAIGLIETEVAVKKMLVEIDSTRRRVNALDYKVVPELQDAVRDIGFHLAENEREDFVRLKKIAGK